MSIGIATLLARALLEYRDSEDVSIQREESNNGCEKGVVDDED